MYYVRLDYTKKSITVFFLHAYCGREGSKPKNKDHRFSMRKGKGSFKH